MRRQGVSFLMMLLLGVLFYSSLPLLSIDGTAYAEVSVDSAQTPEQLENKTKDQQEAKDKNVTYGTLAILVIIIAGMLGYMWALQRRYFSGCKDEKQMTLFSQSPAGLPTGTIRSMIAFSVVILSLYFISLQVLGVVETSFPEALGSLLGAVIGFYFGSRSSGPADSGMLKQVDEMKQQRDTAVAEKDGDKANELLKKAKKGVSLTKKVLKYLPEEHQKKYEKLVGKLEQGVDVAEKLNKSGMVSDAVNKAQETFKDFVTENPVKDLIKKAAASFKLALGVSLPQVALITTVVGVGAGLAGLAYQKWKARILHAPFSPAELPLKTIDANTGFSLLVASPIFKKAFMQELQDNDRPFMQSMIDLCIKESDTNAIYTKYKDHFDSRELFEQGLIEFRHNAADRELKEFIDDSAFSAIGGYDAFIGMIDRIHTDNKALADLDALVTVAENLQNEGEPVVEVFKKASEGLEE